MRQCALVMVCFLVGCRLHTLQDGTYQFSATEVLRDDCQLASQPEVLARGTLLTAGHIVRLSYQYLNAEFAGTYRYGLEQMTLDASVVNTRARLRDQACLIDEMTGTLDSVTESPSRFSGTLSLTFRTTTLDACNCRFLIRFDAVRVP
jgi:hypothetical protein